VRAGTQARLCQRPSLLLYPAIPSADPDKTQGHPLAESSAFGTAFRLRHIPKSGIAARVIPMLRRRRKSLGIFVMRKRIFAQQSPDGHSVALLSPGPLRAWLPQSESHPAVANYRRLDETETQGFFVN
jgi:hypothetical protein